MSLIDASAGVQSSTDPISGADLSELWRSVIDMVAQESPQHRAFLSLTKPLGLLQSDGGSNLLLSAPNNFAKDVLETRLRGVLNEVLSEKLNQKINIAVTVVEDLEADNDFDSSVDEPLVDPILSTPNIDQQPKSGTGRSSGEAASTEPTQLNPRYIFETFVIGASNRFAHAAAVAVAEAPAKAYNPLFIYGESGLGKTHLLHAIGAYAKELYGGVRVRYVSSEEFTNDFINSIRDDKASVFKRRYRDLDVLLVQGLVQVVYVDVAVEREGRRRLDEALELRAAEVLRRGRELQEVDVGREVRVGGHAAGVDLEDLHAAGLVGQADLNLHLEAAGAQHRLVEHVAPFLSA